jgi:hypothetical protein
MWNINKGREDRRDIAVFGLGKPNLYGHELSPTLAALQDQSIAFRIGSSDLAVFKQNEVDLESKIDDFLLRSS